MPLYELVLRGRSDGRFTERKPQVGELVVIDRVQWIVESERSSSISGVDASFLLERRVFGVRPRERSVRLSRGNARGRRRVRIGKPVARSASGPVMTTGAE